MKGEVEEKEKIVRKKGVGVREVLRREKMRRRCGRRRQDKEGR